MSINSFYSSTMLLPIYTPSIEIESKRGNILLTTRSTSSHVEHWEAMQHCRRKTFPTPRLDLATSTSVCQQACHSLKWSILNCFQLLRMSCRSKKDSNTKMSFLLLNNWGQSVTSGLIFPKQGCGLWPCRSFSCVCSTHVLIYMTTLRRVSTMLNWTIDWTSLRINILWVSIACWEIC